VYSEVRRKTDRLVSTYDPSLLSDRKIGLEKESLRVNAAGRISQLDHPEALGKALTHPYITTDFSEALLEMVTPPCDSAKEAVHYLQEIHHFINRRLPDGEHIWNTSMPCILRGGQSVRVGEYGTSHSGVMKHAYRQGLGLRYGRRMQAIAGVHFNFSLPDGAWQLAEALQSPELISASRLAEQASGVSQEKRTHGYFGMLQNLTRIGWIVPYLFGASPAICTSFLAEGEGEEFDVWNTSTRLAHYGTSLRMGKIGYRYREDQPIDLSVRHTDINDYIEDIIQHVVSEHPAYAKMGLRDSHGKLQQLSTSRLQIENEFYSTVRPKQIPNKGELPVSALRERGIRYLELRSVDVNLADPAGVSIEQVAMLEMLMMFAWLCEDSPLEAAEVDACRRNVQLVAHRGREPDLQLELTTGSPSGSVVLTHWANTIIEALEPVAQWLDQTTQDNLYSRSLRLQQDKVRDNSLMPSTMMIEGIKQTGSFFEYTESVSKQHFQASMAARYDESLALHLQSEVEKSRILQSQMESDSNGDFDQFLADYLGQIKLTEAPS